MEQNKLWTYDFSIITAGSFISMLGNHIVGFAMGLLVLDYTKSTLMYAIYIFLFTAPRIVAPIIAGPFLDRFSRKKTIYVLDFISAAFYFFYAAMMFTHNFNFIILALGCFILGTVESVYEVAYTSFYPLLITKGNYQKAYSLASILETLTMVMVPISAYLYNKVGMVVIFVADAITFLLAAILETTIKYKEECENKDEKVLFDFKKYKTDFNEGINYLKAETGLMAITVYFAIANFSYGAAEVLTLPYFKKTFPSGEYVFIMVWGGMVLGRLVGGSLYYKFKMPNNKKFGIALCVYIISCTLHGTYMFFPTDIMFYMCLAIGILGVTSYNIRISSTQSYVPHERKGRFNGTFQMMCTVGMVLGQIVAGSLSTVIGERILVLIVMAVNALAAIVIMQKNRKSVSEIYNLNI